MYTKDNMMKTADKDLLCSFIDSSFGRVTMRKAWGECKPIPQGVSVFRRHESGALEYLFTKADKYPVVIDDIDESCSIIDAYLPDDVGLVLYLNKCMIPIASKHRRFCY